MDQKWAPWDTIIMIFALIFLVIAISSIDDKKNIPARYTIETNINSKIYHTNSITITKNNLIQFKTENGYRWIGNNFIIEENKKVNK